MIFFPHEPSETLVFRIPLHSGIDYFHPKFKLTHSSIHPSAETYNRTSNTETPFGNSNESYYL